MSRSQRPRKAYRPRLAAIPVMPELIREFEISLRSHLGWMTLTGQVKSRDPLDALAQAFNVLNTAHPELMSSPVMPGFRRALQAQIERQNKAGAVTLNHYDAKTLAAGVNALLDALPRADVSRMYQAMQRLRAAEAVA